MKAQPDCLATRIEHYVDQHQPEAVAVLRELIRIPTDTPPGNNAPHAERTAQLLEAMGIRCDLLRAGGTGVVSSSPRSVRSRRPGRRSRSRSS